LIGEGRALGTVYPRRSAKDTFRMTSPIQTLLKRGNRPGWAAMGRFGFRAAARILARPAAPQHSRGCLGLGGATDRPVCPTFRYGVTVTGHGSLTAITQPRLHSSSASRLFRGQCSYCVGGCNTGPREGKWVRHRTSRGLRNILVDERTGFPKLTGLRAIRTNLDGSLGRGRATGYAHKRRASYAGLCQSGKAIRRVRGRVPQPPMYIAGGRCCMELLTGAGGPIHSRGLLAG